MERERRRRTKEEKKGREAAEGEHVQKRKSRDRSHNSREKRKSRDDRSPERELRPTQERADQHRDELHGQSQREDRWLADERRGYDNEQRMESVAEGGGRNAHWSYERPGPRYRTMSYEQPYYQPRFNDHYQFRGGFYQRRPFGRGRGRGYFGGRNFGYYRKDEIAPERYNPMNDDPSETMLDSHREDWDRQDRWPKSNLDADLQQGPSKEQPLYYDARANVHGPLQRGDVALEERSHAERASPVPHSPTSIKRSPENPRCFRRSLYHRSRPPSPLSPGGTPTEAEAKKTTVENEKKSKSASPQAKKEKSPVPRQRQDRKDIRKRTTSASSGYSSSGKSSSRSRSSSSRSRSPRRRSRRDLSPSPERRPPWRNSRPGGRRFGSYGRGRYPDTYRGNGRFRSSYSGAGYGSRRGGGYRYNGREERRRRSRSRSGGRRKRSETRSTSSSGSFSSSDRSRSSSKDDTRSKGYHKDSKAPATNQTRT